MDKAYAIFDMDGTLVDSMGYWQSLAAEFLIQKGIQKLPADLLEQIKPMTITESAAYFIEKFGLPGTPETVAAEMNAMMDAHYRADIPLKEGVKEYLQALNQRNVRMCVASATAKPLMEACLMRLGVLGHFDFLLSCEEVGAGKQKPDIFLACAQMWQREPGEIAVYEDALYALRTARTAGFYTVGIYDEKTNGQWPEIRSTAHETINDWRNAV